MVGLDFERENLESLGLRDLVDHATEPVSYIAREYFLPVLWNPYGVIRGLVDGVAGALDAEFHVRNSVPYSRQNTRGRRFLPALKGGVSAPKIL